jgi:periplasmic protein TonB
VASQLLKQAGRGHRNSRIAVAAAIAVGHAVLIAVGMLARGHVAEDMTPAPIVALLLMPERDEQPLPSLPKHAEVPLPEVVVPQVEIEIRQDVPPPITVAVSVAPAPVVAYDPPPATQAVPAASEVNSAVPILATAVEYVRPPAVHYPPAARQARASGTVLIRAVVDTDGHVREVRVDRSSGYSLLDKAAGEAVLGALFRPYIHNGIARLAIVIVPVEFNLRTRTANRG